VKRICWNFVHRYFVHADERTRVVSAVQNEFAEVVTYILKKIHVAVVPDRMNCTSYLWETWVTFPLMFSALSFSKRCERWANWSIAAPSVQYNDGCKLHPNQAKGKLVRGGFGRQLYDTTSHYITNKRITNNKLLSSKSPLSFPPGLWDIFMAEQHNRLQLHLFRWACNGRRLLATN